MEVIVSVASSLSSNLIPWIDQIVFVVFVAIIGLWMHLVRVSRYLPKLHRQVLKESLADLIILHYIQLVREVEF